MGRGHYPYTSCILKVVKVSGKIGRAAMYRVNREYPLVKGLNEMVNEISLQIAEEESEKIVK